MQYPANAPNMGSHPAGFVNPEYSNANEDHIYAEIYEDIDKFSPNSGASYQNQQQSYTNKAFTTGAKTTNEYQNYLNSANAHPKDNKIRVNIINGSNNESHDFDQSFPPPPPPNEL